MNPDPFANLVLLTHTQSTNDDAAAYARRGETVAVATDRQLAGRGRLGRQWHAPAVNSLAFSFTVPDVSPLQERWLPLLAALAAAGAAAECSGARAGVKWPNDILLHDGEKWRKAGGVLCEKVAERGASGGWVVVGIGLNVRGGVSAADGSPLPGAISCEQAAGARGRDVPAALEAVQPLLNHLRRALRLELPEEARSRYLEMCVTIGERVRVDLLGDPGAEEPVYSGSVKGAEVSGEAVDIDDNGRLLIANREKIIPVAVGDVHHLRPAN
ncbi:biotin--[acetyl-CoA-carboxylase] ligase [Dermabacteraceae bacterium TAE3-ERU27]|nr:biotin--[acetyl-CoA-carboxylase] ligase [Dermabacteraceae bacterium TAE3-ERU27]